MTEEVATMLQDISRTDQLKNLDAELKRMGNSNSDYPDITVSLKIFHLNAIQSLFEEDSDLISVLLNTMTTAGSTAGRRVLRQIKRTLEDKAFEASFAGFEFEEDRTLTEFISTFFEELLIDYVFQSKIITDGKDENDPIT